MEQKARITFKAKFGKLRNNSIGNSEKTNLTNKQKRELKYCLQHKKIKSYDKSIHLTKSSGVQSIV